MMPALEGSVVVSYLGENDYLKSENEANMDTRLMQTLLKWTTVADLGF